MTVGDEFGARQLTLNHLYGDQRRAAEGIIHAVNAVAVASFSRRDRRQARGDHRIDSLVGAHPSDFDRPHHAFVIDGKRGSGKTSVLLTLRPYLAMMRLGGAGGVADGDEIARRRAQDLADMKLQVPPDARGNERVALVLPIVFAEDMEIQETTMEGVFAFMEHVLDEEMQICATDDDRRGRLKQLRLDLRSKVGVAWTYSRKIGVETLSSDSLDYRDFVHQRAKISRDAYTKVTVWRRFVENYLDVLGYETLVLLFDDSDLNPTLAEDLIRTIRMYLNHPRVISILAVDMSTLRQTLHAQNLTMHKIVAAGDGTAFRGDELSELKDRLIKLEAENTSALLDKVLPRPNRHRLAMSDLKHLDHFFRNDVNGEPDPFGALCRDRFSAAATREEGLSWWFLFGPYRRIIAGDLRGVLAFRNQVSVPGASPVAAVFDRHPLSSLADRAEGGMEALENLVAAGDIEADALNDEERRFIDFWTDIRIAEAGGEPSEAPIIAAWVSAGEDGYASERQEMTDKGTFLGVSSYLRNELLPRSCLYMHQLRHLEQILAEPVPSATPLATSLEALDGETVGNLTFMAAATRLHDALTQNIGRGLDDEKSFRFVQARIQGPLTRPIRSAYSDAQEQFAEETALDAALLLAICHSPPDSQATGKSGAGFKILDAGLSRIAAGDEAAIRHAEAFVDRLSTAVRMFERRRQEALLIWACANEIAAHGDERTSLTPRRASRAMSSTWGAPTAKTSATRLRRLVDMTSNAARTSGPRQRLLLAWSILPLIPTIFDYGADYAVDPDAGRSWATIAGFLDDATEVRPTSATVDRPGDWQFPDILPATLDAIYDEVRTGAAQLRNDLEQVTPAGMLPEGSFWKAAPARRVATLLGTTERWVERNLAV